MAEATSTFDSGSDLPPPPPVQRPDVMSLQPITRRAGQVSTGWQIMLCSAWIAAFFAFAAVWKTSQDIGIGTWWLGARADPQPVLVKIIPFAIAIAIGLAAIYNVRRVATISLAGAIGLALVAVFDISRSGGLAAIEFAIAACLVLVSAGAATGTYRATRGV